MSGVSFLQSLLACFARLRAADPLRAAAFQRAQRRFLPYLRLAASALRWAEIPAGLASSLLALPAWEWSARELSEVAARGGADG